VKVVRFLVALVVAGSWAVPALPAAAQTPSIARYFLGTWNCTTDGRSVSAMAYGLTNDGATLALANGYVSGDGNLGQFYETDVEKAGTFVVTTREGDGAFIATSTGWQGDTLSFVGTVADVTRSRQKRMTYRRIDAGHFDRTFEVAGAPAEPWKVTSHATCQRAGTVGGSVVVSAPANESGLQKLAIRLAGSDGARIYVGALPKDWTTPVPLPAGATIVGSVRRGANLRIYYDLPDSGKAVITAYTSRLVAAGWTSNSTLEAFHGGFSANAEVPVVLCGPAGQPGVTISSPERNGSFEVSIAPHEALCASTNGPLAFLGQMRGPLPTLVAPDGVAMTSSPLPYRFGASGAKLVSKDSIATLIQAFTAQMTAANWHQLDSTVGAHAGSASFSITDERGVPWEAILTIYAAPDRSDTYYSLVDTTNLKGDGPFGSAMLTPPTLPQ